MAEVSERLHRLRWEIRRLLETRPDWSTREENEYQSLIAMEAALLSLSDDADGLAEVRRFA